MTPTSRRLGVAALVIVASAALLTACSTAPEPEETASTAPSEPAPAETTAAPSAEPTTAALTAPPCDKLIPASTVASYESVGWTWQEDLFRVGSIEIEDGIVCRWADFTTASDQIQMFGWAPITPTEAKNAQRELFESGWIEVEDSTSANILITENPDFAISLDDEGYGQTYEFGDGWVTFSDTKQSLLLIERPQG